MLISFFKGHLKGIVLILVMVFVGNILINTLPTSAAPFPTIFSKPQTWRAAYRGFFHDAYDAYGDVVIPGGFYSAYSYPAVGMANGGGTIVSDSAYGTRFTDEMLGHLNSSNTQHSVGAAFIIFTMLGKSPSEAGSDPVGAAKGFFDEWKGLVDAYFDEGRVARVMYPNGSAKGITNTMYNKNNPGDVVWYKTTAVNKDFDSLLFLNKAGDSITDATYAIRIKCGNPLGGDGEICVCENGTEPCCEEEDPIPTPPSSCPINASDTSYKIDYGKTHAQSGVVNMTKDKTWALTDGKTQTPAVVWAKPGDSVQFKHTLCFGVQEVRGSNQPSPDQGRTTSPERNLLPDQNTATIRAFTAPATPSGNYLFKNTLTDMSSQTFNLSQKTKRPPEVAGADEVGDYFFTYYSPSIKSGNNAGDLYSCSDVAGFEDFKTNGYQIPDFTATTVPANCAPAREVPTNSDAGKVIEQDLEWNNVTAYVNKRNVSSSGGCGCSCSNSNNAEADNVTVAYNGAVSASGDGTIGNRVRYCYSTGGSCGGGCCNRCSGCCGTSYSMTNYKYHPLATSSPKGETQKAQVKIPFNYTTSTIVTTETPPQRYGGGDEHVTVTIDVNPRSNPDVSDSDYATITKDSVYEVVAFTVNPGANYTNGIKHEDKAYPNNSSGLLACNYYSKGSGVSKCLSVKRSNNAERLNDEGDLSGGTEVVYNGDLAVPDAEIGTKFCVAVGVWPSDSHNAPTGEASGAGDGDTALKNGTGSYWNFSEPACRTITKKPMVQFHSAGAYTMGGVVTSQTKKSAGYSFGLYGDKGNLQSGSVSHPGDNKGARRVFGSFTEYETIALGNVTGFASGAGFGYGQHNNGNLGSSTALPGGYPEVPYTGEAKVCTYSSQSFNNDRCNEKVVGASLIKSSGGTLINRLKARYTSDDSLTPTQSGVLNLGGGYVLDNGARYIKANGDASINSAYCMNKSLDTSKNNTLVIDVAGTLTIRGNIRYGSGAGNGCSDEGYRNIAEMPQVLIFADHINIESGVVQIDAWLIAGQKVLDRGDGIINTCSNMSAKQIGMSGDKGYIIPTGDAGGVPCPNQLRVNGPVFAKGMILNRNAGAGIGNASIQPAEVFSLRPDTYLWTYNQATRFSQAVTTYQRELSPRY